MDFYDYLAEIAEKYGIQHEGLAGLGMPHGIYTGGESLVSKTKGDLESCLKPLTNANLDYYFTEAEQVELTNGRWINLMQMAIGEIAVYEWECVRNRLDVDHSLRWYLDKLVKLKPGA